jgi:starch-binding outer membrane protein, SusD/RagB family
MNKFYTYISLLARRSFLPVQLAIVALCMHSCKEFIEVDAPRTDLVRSTTFADDASANAAMIDIYYSMHFNGFASGDILSLTYLGSLASDEMLDYSGVDLKPIHGPFFENTLTPKNDGVIRHWDQLYSWIYKANSVIEGVSTSEKVSADIARQLEGEAKFIRAFAHFYLVNLWGDIPLVTSTDYLRNASLGRTQSAKIYEQIIVDLEEAAALLPDGYAHAGGERTRPNRFAAAALLARAYLYAGEYAEAETSATLAIEGPSYGLESDLNLVFQKTSTEAIWQFRSFTDYPQDIFTFYMFGTPPTWGALRPGFIDEFEDGDQRLIDWVGNIPGDDGELFYFPIKYKSFMPTTEYSTILRLAEVYLIRAEARAQLGKLSEAQEDLNAIRTRAHLGNTAAADKESLLEAIGHERRLELFTEWGHRWLDLKRSGKIDEVLSAIKPQWKSSAALFPIPEQQLLNSPVAQNPGY